MTALGFQSPFLASQLLFEMLKLDLEAEGLTKEQVDDVVALAFQRARETVMSPLESITKSRDQLRRRRLGLGV